MSQLALYEGELVGAIGENVVLCCPCAEEFNVQPIDFCPDDANRCDYCGRKCASLTELESRE